MASLRYQCWMASYRLENMSETFGIKIADSTQWFLFESAAPLIQLFIEFLENEVANAPVQHTDDTYNTVLSLVKKIENEQQQAFLQGRNPKSIRCGIHTTNVTGVFPQGQIILYKKGLHHSVEILAQLLQKRTLEEQIIVMADTDSENTSKINFNENFHIKMTNCNVHLFLKFKELAQEEQNAAQADFNDDFQISEPLNYFLFRYKKIFENDQISKSMNSLDRLLFHKKNSLPIMNAKQQKAEKIISQKLFEPNSKTFTVLKYFLNSKFN